MKTKVLFALISAILLVFNACSDDDDVTGVTIDQEIISQKLFNDGNPWITGDEGRVIINDLDVTQDYAEMELRFDFSFNYAVSPFNEQNFFIFCDHIGSYSFTSPYGTALKLDNGIDIQIRFDQEKLVMNYIYLDNDYNIELVSGED